MNKLQLFVMALLVSMFSTMFASCGGGGNDDKDDPTPPSTNPTYTGSELYRYPLFYWNKSKSFIKSKETLQIFKDDNETLSYYGSGKVFLIMYSFESNKLVACGMAVDWRNREGFADTLTRDFNVVSSDDEDIYLISKDRTILAITTVSNNNIVTVFVPNSDDRSIDSRSIFSKISLTDYPKIESDFYNFDILKNELLNF